MSRSYPIEIVALQPGSAGPFEVTTSRIDIQSRQPGPILSSPSRTPLRSPYLGEVGRL